MTVGLLVAGWLVAAVACVRLRRRAELVARASHEVRGPLTAALLAIAATRSGAVLPAAALDALDAQIARARLALDDLALAPLGRRRADRPARVSLSNVLGDLATAWTPVAASHGRHLQVVAAPGDLQVLADPGRVAQAASNLLANAIEHGGGAIELRARRAGQAARLEVRDAGPGLSARRSRRSRRRRSGRGRGLAIAAAIAERQGGRLTVLPSPGGAAVAIDLPTDSGDAA